ncbi:MAG TPA: cystathionine beta-lyase [Candidatus Binataceae bacterium]|nr:cystathionine beta-lyase [Candidatus Binataceae bacterium]
MKDETIAVVAGRDPKAHYGAVNTPVYRASTILFETFDDFAAAVHDPAQYKFSYGRTGTPTSASLEDAIMRLEGGAHCRLAPSGLAAITTALLAFLSSGDHLLMTLGAYHPTHNFCNSMLKQFGVETTYYDPLVGADIEKLMRPNTKVVFVESPSTGLFEVQDIPAIAQVAHAHGAVVMMDNTWASPLYFKPFAHGVDVSIQAATKYIVGHSDAMLGSITCTDGSWDKVVHAHQHLGQMAGPDDIYLALRGLRTLSARLPVHHRNGVALARYVAKQPEVERVYHPALETDPNHALWKRDFLGASGLFSFSLKPWVTREALAAMLEEFELFGIGASWGGFESLVLPFRLKTYRNVAKEDDRWVVRVHAGLENVDDLIEDLRRGFAKLAAMK